MNKIKLGDTLTCAETGKTFIAAADGCTTNYAIDSQGRVYSEEGAHLCDVRNLLDRTKPFVCYVSLDNKSITGWEGNRLGSVLSYSRYRGNMGAWIYCYSVQDVHGQYWHGRNSGEGMAITLRPSKPANARKYYIQRKGGGYLETVDEFPTYSEARKMLREYRLADPSAAYYLSSRACASWARA